MAARPGPSGAFLTPARHADSGQDLAATVAGLDDGLGAAETGTGITCPSDRRHGPGVRAEREGSNWSTGSPG
jgi:hypothetical protein